LLFLRLAFSRFLTFYEGVKIELESVCASEGAYSGEVGHAFQSKPAGHSGGSRPPIPVIPATLVGA